MSSNTRSTKKNEQSEFFYDLIDVFGGTDSNANLTQNNTNKVSNPTIIRPNVAPRAKSLKQPAPLPNAPPKYGSIINVVPPKPTIRKKKPAPPRPPPPKLNQAAPSPRQRLSKVPPSYSKVLEEDIRACIDAYSGSSKPRTSSSVSDSSVNRSLLDSNFKNNRSKSDGQNSNLISFDSPLHRKSDSKSVNVNGVNVTTKNLKQAGAAASFLNRNPKFAKHVVPAEYQGAVKLTGKAYDFREQHKDTFKTSSSSQNVDLLSNLSLNAPQNNAPPKISNLSVGIAKPAKPAKPPSASVAQIPVSGDFNAGWGDEGSSHKSHLDQSHGQTSIYEDAPAQPSILPSSPTIPEPEHPPPLLNTPDDSLPKFEAQGVALVNYTAAKDNELSFQMQDIIYLIKEDKDMYFGHIGDKQGYFPKFCVDVLVPLSNEINNEEVGQLASKTEADNVVAALYDYDGDTSCGDVSFKAGQKIEVLSQISADWLYGKCNGQLGQFPATFVEAIPEGLPAYEADNEPAAMHEALALFDFEGAAHDELSFKKDDQIMVVDHIDDSWCRGYVLGASNVIGIFPVAYVQVNHQSDNPVHVRVIHPFEASSPDEMSLQVNQVITVVQVISDEWMIGRNDNGYQGLFPSSFVENIS